jgi:hypothetical protein
MKMTMPWTATRISANGVSDRLEEVRRVLSGEADNLAEVASQIGQEVGDQAVTVARDASLNAGSLIGLLRRNATRLGPMLIATTRRSARDLGKDARHLGEELRHVRITTEPKKTGPNLMPGIAVVGGIGAGIAVMYFLDPEQGSRRREQLGDRLRQWTRLGRETVTEKAGAFRERTVGVMQQAQAAIGGRGEDMAEPELPGFDADYQPAFSSTNTPRFEEAPVEIG